MTHIDKEGRGRGPGLRLISWIAALGMCIAACGDDGPGGDPDAGNSADAAAANPDAAINLDAGADPAEPEALQGITALHNQVRATVGVAPLVWDPELAAVAQSWVDQCIDNQPPAGLIDHNDGRSDNYPGYVGENVYGSSGPATPTGAVGAWAAEEVNYDYPSNTCAPNQVCGHYTQIVWAASERLGCGISYCSGLTYANSIVCNYSPGGNNGGWPY